MEIKPNPKQRKVYRNCDNPKVMTHEKKASNADPKSMNTNTKTILVRAECVRCPWLLA